jgi:hypothetical protein
MAEEQCFRGHAPRPEGQNCLECLAEIAAAPHNVRKAVPERPEDPARADCPFCGEGYGSSNHPSVRIAWEAWDELERLRDERWLT